jgi:hypothetical protein
MELNWQTIIVILLLLVAVGYVTRVIARAFQGKHDCPDCDMPAMKPKVKKARPLRNS